MSEIKQIENYGIGYKKSIPIGICSNSPCLVSEITIYPDNFVIDANLTLNGKIIWEQKNINTNYTIPFKKDIWVGEHYLAAWYGQTYLNYEIKNSVNTSMYNIVTIGYNMSNMSSYDVVKKFITQNM